MQVSHLPSISLTDKKSSDTYNRTKITFVKKKDALEEECSGADYWVKRIVYGFTHSGVFPSNTLRDELDVYFFSLIQRE